MRLLRTFAPAVLLPALAIAGCGGGDDKPTTVVKTVVQAPTQPTAAPTAPAPTSVPTTATPAEQPDPVANLPEGTPAVSGEFAMEIRSSEEDTFISSDEDEGEERKWFAAMACDGTDCTVELRRELPQGGFKTLTLREDGDPRRYAANSVGGADACGNKSGTFGPKGPPRQRLSIRITGTQDVAGQETATRLDGYLTVQQRCGDDRQRVVTQYRGGRPYEASEEQQVP